MKKIFSITLSLMMVAAVIMPALSSESYGAVSVRTSMPSYSSAEGKAYYYSNNNVFYKYNLGPNQKYLSSYGGYVVGNCTWYAYARASEILGKPLNSNFRWSASQWWNTNKNGNYYPYGSTPKVGAIACYSTHVAIVEKVVNGKPYVSESGWMISKSKPTSASKLRFHYGSPWGSGLKGYIYITDSKTAAATNVNYSVKVSISQLNMRTGPGTGYSRVGYIKPGTYAISQQSGNWGKLASNGYWIYLSYATKVQTTTETIVNTGTATNYNVKVSITNLNMRTGPSTSYTRKGYISPGTYNIVKTSNGWGKLASNGYWIYLQYAPAVSSNTTTTTTTTTSTSYNVTITASSLNMRTGPGTNYSSKGLVRKGATYTIKATQNGWGQLKANNYWIKLSYTVPVSSSYNVKVSIGDLRMRSGPGTSYASKGFIKPGVHTIVATSNGWGKLQSNGYWIYLSYATKL